MSAPSEEQDRSGGFARVIDSLWQTAQRAAQVAVVAVRTQADGVVDLYRAELRRTVAVFALACAVLLFIWSAAVFAVVGLEIAWWDTHRAAASLCGAAAFLLLGGVSALVLWGLTRRGRPFR